MSTDLHNQAGDPVGNISDEIVTAAIARAVAEDRENRRVSSRLAYTLVSIGMFAVVALFFFNLHQIASEGASRRSQTCATFEGQHLQEVRQLKSTYDYLAALPPAEQKLAINKFVIRQLPQTERIAAKDTDNLGVRVPPYCDEPNVGLPEPDPKVPERPLEVDRLIHSLIPQAPVQPFDRRDDHIPADKP